MKPSDLKIVKLLKYICDFHGERASDFIQSEAERLRGQDEVKRGVFLRLQAAFEANQH